MRKRYADMTEEEKDVRRTEARDRARKKFRAFSAEQRADYNKGRMEYWKTMSLEKKEKAKNKMAEYRRHQWATNPEFKKREQERGANWWKNLSEKKREERRKKLRQSPNKKTKSKIWRASNRNKCNEYVKKWRKNNPEQSYEIQKRGQQRHYSKHKDRLLLQGRERRVHDVFFHLIGGISKLTNRQHKMKIPTEQDMHDFNTINGLFSSSLEGLGLAGEMLVTKLDAGWTLKECAAVMEMRPLIVTSLERIGRKQLLPALMFETFDAASKLRSLPYSEQVRLLNDDPIEVIVPGDGAPDIRRVTAREMPREYVPQVFRKSGIASLSEQRSWLEAAEKKKVKPTNGLPYTVEDHGVRVAGPCYLSFKEMKKIIAKAESVKIKVA